MKTARLTVVLFLVLASAGIASAQGRREINIPDIPGYLTLKCDFHMHTVFSDGSVWPTVRVSEAWRDGLDCIAVTDHIEYHPKKDDIPINHKRPYEIAAGPAADYGILLIRAAEITRDTPPGHHNALFLDDIQPLDTKEFMDVMNAAKAQKAFVFWNHPGWKAKPGENYIADINNEVREKGLIQGVEIVNGLTLYTDAWRWALEHDLALMADSDIHSPLDPRPQGEERHRPVTLVFARERTVEAVKDALVNGRTAIWHEKQLIGKAWYLEALFAESVKVAAPHQYKDNAVWIRVHNSSEIAYELTRTGKAGPAKTTLPAQSTMVFKIALDKETHQAELAYTVDNLLTAPGKGLPITYTVTAPAK